MRALGRRLDSAATAVYWHVGSKDHLIVLAADRAMATLFTFVLGNALGPAAEASLMRKFRGKGGDPEVLIRDTMASARDIAARFPRLRARLGSAAVEQYGAAPEKTFEFGLRAILDGLEARLVADRDRLDRAGRTPRRRAKGSRA